VFSANPETVSGEPQEGLISVAHSVRRGTRQPACSTILRFSLSLRFLCRDAGELSHRLKVSLLSIYCHQISHQLASYSECCAIGVPSCRAFSYTKARSGFRLGANFVASIRTPREYALFLVSHSTSMTKKGHSYFNLASTSSLSP